MTAEHMLTDHLNQAAENPDITINTPHLHKNIDEPQEPENPRGQIQP